MSTPLSTLAPAFARLALHNIAQEFPNKLDHVINDVSEVCAPRVLHPVFYGSYDWHSSVHMHWLLARLLRLNAALPEAGQISAAFDRHFTAAAVAGEIAYLRQASRQSFERTYGWAWLLKLQAELMALAAIHPRAALWRNAVQALADAFVERTLQFLPITQHPIRAGTHANSAFGLLFALDYAEACGHSVLRQLIVAKAQAWFGADRLYPADYELGGDDFLSGGLLEAVLMRRVSDARSHADWWQAFCPAPKALQRWLVPVDNTDRSDPKLSHLDGLNLSRAWCWRMLEKELPETLRDPVRQAIDAHLAAALPHTHAGHYVGTHWLASFAVLALSEVPVRVAQHGISEQDLTS
jgi:hypothetical protein